MEATIDQGAYELLRDLVSVNSGTSNVEGCEDVRRLLIPAFEAIGLRATEHALESGRKVLSFEAPDARPGILFVGHLDTVYNDPKTPSRFWREGERLRGPGVIDMKGGIVVMREILRGLRDTDAFKSVRIVLNDDEETGSVFSRGKIKELADGMSFGLVFEPGLPDGAVVTAHSGVRWLELVVHGRSVHAGLEPEKGLSAAVELGHKLVKLGALTDLDRQLTVNPGVIRGGVAPNVVCDKATVQLDVRFVREGDLNNVMTSIEAIKDTVHVRNEEAELNSTAEMKEIGALPPMPAESTQYLYDMARGIAVELGQTLPGRAVGYASDGNHLAQTGIKLLVGLGPYGGYMHSPEEFMLESSFNERVTLGRELVLRLAQKLEAS